MQVMGERRGGDPEFLLQMTDRQALIASPNERSVELEARWVAKRFELLRRFFDFHGNNANLVIVGRQVIFPQFSKVDPIVAISKDIGFRKRRPPP